MTTTKRKKVRLAPKMPSALLTWDWDPGFEVLSFPEFKQWYANLDYPLDFIDGLIPGIGIGMYHGQPRAGKTLLSMAGAVALAAGQKSFLGFEIPEPKRVLYLSEEDPPLKLIERVLATCKGMGVSPNALHGRFYPLSRRGVSLDDGNWQNWVLREVLLKNIDYLVFDPLRSLTATADQGPREIQPFVTYVRAVQNAVRDNGKELVVEFVHHDRKMPDSDRGQKRRQERPTAHDASGGAILSVVETPKTCVRRSLKLQPDSTTEHKVHHMLCRVTPSLTKWDAETDPFDVRIRIEKSRVPVLDREGRPRANKLRWQLDELRFDRSDVDPVAQTDTQAEVARQIDAYFSTQSITREAAISASAVAEALKRDVKLVRDLMKKKVEAGGLASIGDGAGTRYFRLRKVKA